MFSLFSSFDYFCLNFPKISELFLLSLLFCCSFKFSVFKKIFSYFSSFFNSFLSSLNLMGYKKMVVYFYMVLMTFFLLMNLIAVFPFNFAHTSQVGLVLTFGFGLWLSLMFFINGSNLKGFLSHAVPEGTPMVLVPFLFLIEIVSNVIRPVTLTVRLVANILAGHLLLILLSKVVFYTFPAMVFYFMLNSVEFFVALIQSYIFVTMVSLYYCEMD